MTALNPYPEYKDSGVEWLADVPEHWLLEPLGKLFTERKMTVSDANYAPLSVTRDGIVPQLDNVAKTVNGEGRKLVMAGDFAINSRSDRKGSSGLADRDGSVSVITTVITPRRMNPYYAHHLLRSVPFQEEYYRYGSGIVADLWSTRWSAMKGIRLAVPPRAEQSAIAAFLDRETAQIDAFIADQEELIGLLAERRAATIESMFDRALERKPLRATIAIAQTGPFGTQLSATEYVSGGTPVLNPTHIQQGRIEVDNDVSVTPETAAVLSRFAFMVGDIVLGRKGEVDKSALIDELYAGAICGSDSMLIRPDRWTNPRYLWWFFQSVGAHGQLERWSVGSTVTGLNQNTISQIRVPYGDANFQALCVHDLDAEVGELDAAIADAREAIALSRERRAALISAAVTGKIDVRSAA